MRDNWFKHEEYPDYLISDRGQVYDQIKDERVDTDFTPRKGLKAKMRHRDGDERVVDVAVLLAEAYLGKAPGPNYKLNYRDGNRFNVYIKNIEWVKIKTKRASEITYTELYRTARVIDETGRIYNSVWEYCQKTGEDEASAKRSIRKGSKTKHGHTLKVYDIVRYVEDL